MSPFFRLLLLPAAAASAALAGLRGTVQLDDKTSATYTVSADQQDVDFVVTLTAANSWLGFGVATEDSPEMTSGGKGTDAFICSDGKVMRYWLTKAELPTGGVPAEGATCTQADGTTKMTFSRKVASTSATERAISLTSQNFIWAYTPGNTTLCPHTSEGTKVVDLTKPVPPTPSPPPAPAGTIPLGQHMSATYALSSDQKSVSFVVIADSANWFGLGVSVDGSMDSAGKGSDIVACTGGRVLRYWVTEKGAPTKGVEVPGATCTQADKSSKMSFSRGECTFLTVKWSCSVLYEIRGKAFSSSSRLAMVRVMRSMLSWMCSRSSSSRFIITRSRSPYSSWHEKRAGRGKHMNHGT